MTRNYLMAAAILGLLLLGATFSKAIEPFQITGGIQVIDGDTIRVQHLHLAYGASLYNQTVRVHDLDTWETRRGRGGIDYHEDEIAKGKTAAEAVAKLINDAQAAFVMPWGTEQRDSFGRIIGMVVLRTKDGKVIILSQWMKENGHDRTSWQNMRDNSIQAKEKPLPDQTTQRWRQGCWISAV